MLTPFAKLVLFGLFLAALVALVVIRVTKWLRGRSAAAPAAPRERMQSPRASAAATSLSQQQELPFERPTTSAQPTQLPKADLSPEPLASDVPTAKPLDSSSILVGNRDPRTAVASSLGAASDSAKRSYQAANRSAAQNAAYLSEVPELPDLEPGDIPVNGTGDYRYGEAMTRSMAAMLPESPSKRDVLKKDLVNAGEYTPHAYDNFRAMRALGVFGSILLCLLALVLVPPRLEGLVIAGLIILPLVFWALPTVLMRNKAAERRREIENGMPDMLDLLSMCVSQGMTVPNALGRVATELKPVYPALSQELTITEEHARVGTLEGAMQGLSRRVDIPEVHSFTSLVSQTERMGTSVSESLEVYSDNIREGLRQRADQKANTASFKLLFPTVLFLMPAVFLFLLGPALLDIADFFNSGTAEGVLNANAASNLSDFAEQ